MIPSKEPRISVLGSLSPWYSRTPSPRPSSADGDSRTESVKQSSSVEHTATHGYRRSRLHYPQDCPALKCRWFYAVDSPKSKPILTSEPKQESKPLPAPKKFVSFSLRDSQALEAAYQELSKGDISCQPSRADRDGPQQTSVAASRKVPVNEDYLFDVDVGKRELSPAYWLGPVYEVRRGTWFFQEGSVLRPCEENLATQLEEGYLKVKPWLFQEQHKRSSSQPSVSTDSSKKSRSSSIHLGREDQSVDPGKASRNPAESVKMSGAQSRSHRLFGAYMNSIAYYHDSVGASLKYDDFVSRMSTTVYESLGGVGGIKVVRGFQEQKGPKESIDKYPSQGKPQAEAEAEDDLRQISTHNPQSQREPTVSLEPQNQDDLHLQTENNDIVDQKRSTLRRHLSSFTGEAGNTAALEESRRQEEKEMEDSRDADGDNQERDIDHLLLVTHGIGQRLGLRLENINFIQDVNVLRKTMKSVYAASPDLQALNSSYPDARKNCRVQVLPVCWRHLLAFPHRKKPKGGKELDLADVDASITDDDEYPSLADVTLDGIPAIRNLLSDLAMDVLLYQSAYREDILTIVQQECNRIWELFKQRHPSFRGTVSLCGHSLGSAILFDLLCNQPESGQNMTSEAGIHLSERKPNHLLEFNCQSFFCLGSPLALFQMLRGKSIVGRPRFRGSNGPRASLSSDPVAANTFQSTLNTSSVYLGSPLVDANYSSPKCTQLYNIFHPSDPISYRIEPLISTAMTALKPQPLPSIKRGIWASSGQSISNISSRVGQSVGSLWTSLTTGVATGLLHRSLGVSLDGAATSALDAQGRTPTSLAEASNQSANTEEQGWDRDDDKTQTLIDPEIETLYEGFNKTRRNDLAASADGHEKPPDEREVEERAAKLRNEELKVRALNSNGRVDYKIQEGAFDISLIASIASHLCYWADEDVNHFMLSQMLSEMKRIKRAEL